MRVEVMAGGSEGVERGAPDVAAAGHAEGSEDKFVHNFVQGLAGDLFDDGLDVDIAFTGIAETFAGSEIDFERLVVTPVPKTGAMAEDNAGGDFGKKWVVYIWFWQI